jgi:hypothetical protein
MKTRKPKFKMNKSKSANVKSFWNGTIMSDLNFKPDMWRNIQKELQKDFFSMFSGDELDSHIQIVIDMLDHNEKIFFNQYSKNGTYSISNRDMVQNMLLINELVKRGIRPNDNNYGLMIMFS